jgi:two-component system response regulator YesN
VSSIVRLDAAAAGMDLRSLVDVTALQRIQDEFASDTGLGMITVDAIGTPVTSASGFSALCQYLRRDPKIRQRCMSCDAHGGLQSAIEGRPVVYQCHIGLVDFSVSIMAGTDFLGAILCGQVLLRRDQDKLHQILRGTDQAVPGELASYFEEVSVIDLEKLHTAADAVVRLANQTLVRRKAAGVAAIAGPYLGRLPPVQHPGGGHQLAPLLAGASKPLPLIPMVPVEPPRLDPRVIAINLTQRNIAANLQVLSDYLDGLLPRWSQKIKAAKLAEFEDVLIGLATTESVQYGREISQQVTRHRRRRTSPMNRYECQLYCEQLLVRLHNLLEPDLEAQERTIGTLLNEIEKDPTRYQSVAMAAEYMNWSESHFSRKFKQATDESYIQYVTAKKLERAKLMLAHTDRPVMRIAAALGFQPVNYFSRTFKKHVGLTPSEYRLQHIQEGTP